MTGMGHKKKAFGAMVMLLDMSTDYKGVQLIQFD